MNACSWNAISPIETPNGGMRRSRPTPSKPAYDLVGRGLRTPPFAPLTVAELWLRAPASGSCALRSLALAATEYLANALRWIVYAVVIGLAPKLTGAVPSADLAGMRYEQKIGTTLPLDAVVRDESGATHRLAEYFGSRPVVLVFGYSRCAQLCSVIANGTVEVLRQIVPVAGADCAVLYVSIDPNDTSRDLAGMKERDVRHYGRGDAGAWHYVAGSAAEIGRLAQAAGFHFRYDQATRQYAHPSGFVVVTPQGVVSRYFLGVDFAAKDLASALRRAADGKTGESVFELLLVCARGTGMAGRYSGIVWRALSLGVLLTVGALAWGIGAMLRRERLGRRDAAEKEVLR